LRFTPTAGQALANQDKTVAAIAGFHAAKQALFAVKNDLEQAKKELEAARKAGDQVAILTAEQRVRVAEAKKAEQHKDN
jgi:hypothetical protein